jgi:hypothetical protein
LPDLATAKRKEKRCSGTLGASVSSVWSFSQTAEAEEARAKLQAQELEGLRQRGFRIFEWDDLAEQAHGLLADSDGYLWKVARGEPLEGHQPGTSAVALGRGYVMRPKDSEPRTQAELDRLLAAEEAQRAKAAKQAAADLEARRKAAQPVSFAQVQGWPRMSLAEAAAAIEARAGRLEVRDGRLLVCLPASADWTGTTLHAAALLYAAESVVVDCLRAKKPLPDREVSPAGALL